MQRHRILSILTLVTVLVAFASPTAAQVLPSIPGSAPSGSAATLDALFASAPVELDGATIFRIAAPLSGAGHPPIAVRANAVSDALDAVLATRSDGRPAFDSDTLHVEIVRDRTGLVLEAIDAHHRDGLPIVTVTSADAQYQQVDAETVARDWQSALQASLVHALLIRRPEVVRRNVFTVLALLAVLGAASAIAWFGLAGVGRRIGALSREVAEHAARLDAERARVTLPEDEGASVAHRARLVDLTVGRIDPVRRLSLLRTVRAIAIVAAIAAWFAGVAWSALQFSQTAAFGNFAWRKGLAVVAIWVVAILIDRALTVTIERLPTLWGLRAFGTPEEKQRQLLRAPTIAAALAGFKTFVLFFVAGLATMTQIGIPVGSVVTIGGVAAIAVSLAAQNLIRDVVSGFLVLIEDQFVVGDFVTINGTLGTVERLTLRMVQIRDATGSLATISHSAETSVVNHSRNWSRVDFEVSVEVTADLPLALSLIRQQIASLEHDADWQGAIVEPAEWIGIEALSRDGAIVRARIKTAPLRQFALRRELNARVSAAFATAKIGYGAPATATP